jgi:hypothetical protein
MFAFGHEVLCRLSAVQIVEMSAPVAPHLAPVYARSCARVLGTAGLTVDRS